MKLSRTLWIVIIIAINVALDQITKAIARAELLPHKTVQVIGDFFVLTNVENAGAFLGMGSELPEVLRILLLLVLPILVMGGVIYYLLTNKSLDRLSIVALASIVGGGLANIYDRIVYGSVTDFLHLDFGGVFRTGIFNVADMSVTGGMIALLIANYIETKNNKKTAPES